MNDQPVEKPNGICKCGCGQRVDRLSTYTISSAGYWRGYPVPYLSGHRVKATRSDKGVQRPDRQYQPTPEEIPSGICECGCGGSTPIAERTQCNLRWFAGHPKPFIKGHHARHNHLCQKGPGHPAWKGGRYKNTYGYIYIYAPNHPAANCDGHVLEHRLVLKEKLGRLLLPNEHGHHINGIRDDNRPENLIVLTKSEHSQEHAWDLGRFGRSPSSGPVPR